MKKLLFAFMVVSLFACSGDDSAPVDPNNGNPEVCDNVYHGYVVLSTQEEVDAFAANGYCKIEGALTIGANSGNPDFDSTITNLEGLSSIKEIAGNLTVGRNIFLVSLQGLHNLKKVRDITIEHNMSLHDTKGLEGVTELGDGDYKGTVQIRYNPVLKSLEGFENVSKIMRLSIQDNDALESMKGFQNLGRAEFLSINDNDILSSVSDLYGLKEVGNFYAVYSVVDISGNTSLTSLDGLQNITYFDTILNVVNNIGLKDFCALRGVLPIAAHPNPVTINGNAYNPTVEEIILYNCSQP